MQWANHRPTGTALDAPPPKRLTVRVGSLAVAASFAHRMPTLVEALNLLSLPSRLASWSPARSAMSRERRSFFGLRRSQFPATSSWGFVKASTRSSTIC